MNTGEVAVVGVTHAAPNQKVKVFAVQ